MRVLIVHDRTEISDQIESLIKDLHPDVIEFDSVSSISAARVAVASTRYDLCITDLTVPINDGNSPDYQPVSDFLNELFMSSELIMPGDIIGLTRDKTALTAINSDIGAHLMAVVEEDATTAWKKQLSDRLNYVSRVTESRLRSINASYGVDVGIVTALDKELEPFNDLFELHADPFFDDFSYFSFSDMDGKIRQGVVHSVGRAGQASAASATQKMITQYRPSLMIMSGFCGGFSTKDVALGDMVLCKNAFDWDYGKWAEVNGDLKFLSRPQPIGIEGTNTHRTMRNILTSGLNCKAALDSSAAKLSAGLIKSPKMHLSPIASGSAVVSHDEIIKQIAGLNEDIVGVDMEIFGFYYACNFTHVVKPDFFAVKAVSDFADQQKDGKEQAACCQISALFVDEFIKEHWKFCR